MRRSLHLFLLCSVVLCVPSYAAWFRQPFDIGIIEFDPWLALLPVRWPGQLAHFVLFAALGLLYVHICRSKMDAPKWFVPLIWSIYFVAVPWISPDVMFYLAKGWLEIAYDANPYQVTIAALPGVASDRFFVSVAPSLWTLLGNYGPLFQKLSALIAAASMGSPVLGLLLFKAIAVAALFGCFRLVIRLASETVPSVSHLPNWFLLNPILLFNFIAAAHNDVLLMLLILASVLALFRKRVCLSGILLGLSISFKMVGVFLLPAFAIYLAIVFKGRRLPIVAALAFGGLLVGVIGGIVIDPTSITYFRSVANVNAGFRSSIHLLLSTAESGWFDSMLVGKVIFVTVGAVLLHKNWRRFRDNGQILLVVCSFELLLLAQYFVLPSMAEWYLLWPMCFAFCCPGDAALSWCRRVSVLYMPMVVWHVVGPDRLVAFAQITILGFVSIANGIYFVRKFRQEDTVAS